jgi:hypothetical protein
MNKGKSNLEWIQFQLTNLKKEQTKSQYHWYYINDSTINALLVFEIEDCKWCLYTCYLIICIPDPKALIGQSPQDSHRWQKKFQQHLRKVHLQNGHITNHNLTQIGKFNQPSIMTFTKSDKENIYIESQWPIWKMMTFGFEGSGTESSRRLIPIF